jgi:hypothetical protein
MGRQGRLENAASGTVMVNVTRYYQVASSSIYSNKRTGGRVLVVVSSGGFEKEVSMAIVRRHAATHASITRVGV